MVSRSFNFWKQYPSYLYLLSGCFAHKVSIFVDSNLLAQFNLYILSLCFAHKVSIFMQSNLLAQSSCIIGDNPLSKNNLMIGFFDPGDGFEGCSFI